MGLITTEYAQSRLPGVPADTLAALIEAASARFESECGRTFAAADYRESAEGPIATLSNYPTIRVDRVASTPTNALRISNPSAARATVAVLPVSQVSEAPLKLRLAAFVGGSGTSSEIPTADHPTLGSLAVAVQAIGSGWTAEVEGARSDDPSDDLLIAVYHVSGASFGCVLRADSRGRDASFDSPEDQQASILRVQSCGCVRAWYRAGYEEIPADIQEAIVAMIAASLDPMMAGGSAIKKHSLGERDVEFFGAADITAFPKSVRATIAAYRDRRI